MTKRSCVLHAGFILLLACAALLAPNQASAQAAPPGGQALFSKPGIDLLLVGDLDGKGTSAKVPVEGQPFTEALRLTTLKETSMKWEPQVDAAIPVETKLGDVILAEFWMRAVQGKGESGEAQSEFVFERFGEPWTKAIEYGFTVGPQWKKFTLPFAAVETLPAGKSHISFRMGFGPQAYELADLKLTSYGKKLKVSDLPQTKVEYGGMEEDAPWRKAAREGIEKNRKGDLTVTVKRKDGTPVEGAKIVVRMKRHAFGFGSAVVAEKLVSKEADGERYRSEIERLFTRVVFENDLKWGFWESGASNSNGWNRQNVMDSLKWLSERGITIRGHNMVWGGWKYMPSDVQQLKGDPKALAEAIEKRIADVGGKMRGHLVEWDVVNEPVPEHVLTDILGQDALVTWFKKAREADPTALLFLNDYPTPDSVGHLQGDETFVKFLLEQKAPLGGFGLQGHVGTSPWSIPSLLQVLDRFGAYGIPIAITEYDTQVKDAELDARFFRDFLTAVFSHPATNSFLMWGFWDGAHYSHKAPLFTQDWTMKPAGKVYEELVLRDWWTNAEGTTDASGTYKTRGFLGDYEVTVKGAGKKVILEAQLAKADTVLPVVVK